MKLVNKNQTKKFKNSDVCIATEYQMNDKDINGAVIEIKGRYPENGRVTNEKCKELAYIIKGNGKIVVNGKEIKFKEEDLILLEPNEKYYWEGNMKMFVSCSPAWYLEQHKEVK